MAAPVAAAMASEAPSAMRRRNRLNRQLHRLSADHDGVAFGQIGKMGALQSQERPYRMENVAAAKAAKISH